MRLGAALLFALAANCTPPVLPEAATDAGLCWAPVGRVIESSGPVRLATAFIPDSGAESCFDARRRYRVLDLRTGLPAELVTNADALETTHSHNGIFELEVESNDQWRGIGVLFFVRPLSGTFVRQSCRSFEPLLNAYACDGRLYQTDGGLHALQGDDWLAAPSGASYTERNGSILRYDSLFAGPKLAIDGVYDLRFWAADETGISTISTLGALSTQLRDGGLHRSRLDVPSGFDSFHRIDGRTFYARTNPRDGFGEVCEAGGACTPGAIVTVAGSEAWGPSAVVFDDFKSFGKYRWDGGWEPVPGGSFSAPSNWMTMPNTGRAISHRLTFLLPGQRQVVAWLDSPFPEDDLVSARTPFDVTAAGFRWGSLWASGEDAGTVVVHLP